MVILYIYIFFFPFCCESRRFDFKYEVLFSYPLFSFVNDGPNKDVLNICFRTFSLHVFTVEVGGNAQKDVSRTTSLLRQQYGSTARNKPLVNDFK